MRDTHENSFGTKDGVPGIRAGFKSSELAFLLPSRATPYRGNSG